MNESHTPMAGLAAAMERGLDTNVATPLIGASAHQQSSAGIQNQPSTVEVDGEATLYGGSENDFTTLEIAGQLPRDAVGDFAARTETVDAFIYDSATGTIILERAITTRLAPIRWASDVFDKAMRFNILPVIDELYTFMPVNSNDVFGSIATDKSVRTVGAESSQVFNTWAARKRKGKTNGERLEALLRRLSTAMARLESSRTRVRSLKSPSPTPHPDTNDMTCGSAQEISKAEVELQLYEEAAQASANKLSTVLTTLNELGSKVVVSAWEVSLPHDVEAITRLNPPYYAVAAVEPVTDGEAADGEDEDDSED